MTRHVGHAVLAWLCHQRYRLACHPLCMLPKRNVCIMNPSSPAQATTWTATLAWKSSVGTKLIQGMTVFSTLNPTTMKTEVLTSHALQGTRYIHGKVHRTVTLAPCPPPPLFGCNDRLPVHHAGTELCIRDHMAIACHNGPCDPAAAATGGQCTKQINDNDFASVFSAVTGIDSSQIACKSRSIQAGRLHLHGLHLAVQQQQEVGSSEAHAQSAHAVTFFTIVLKHKGSLRVASCCMKVTKLQCALCRTSAACKAPSGGLQPSDQIINDSIDLAIQHRYLSYRYHEV